MGKTNFRYVHECSDQSRISLLHEFKQAYQATMCSPNEELNLARLAIALGATGAGGALSRAEEQLAGSAADLAEPSQQLLGATVAAIPCRRRPAGRTATDYPQATKPSADGASIYSRHHRGANGQMGA